MSITKRILGMIAIGMALAFAQGVAAPQARCGWCPSTKCYGSGACMSCVCMSRDHRGGVCVDLDAVPPGAIVLP